MRETIQSAQIFKNKVSPRSSNSLLTRSIETRTAGFYLVLPLTLSYKPITFM